MWVLLNGLLGIYLSENQMLNPVNCLLNMGSYTSSTCLASSAAGRRQQKVEE